MFDLLITKAPRLWRQSPRWRMLILGSAVMTAVAVLSGGGSSLSPSQAVPSLPSYPTAQTPPAPLPPSGIQVVAPVDYAQQARLDSFFRQANASKARAGGEGEVCEGLMAAAKPLSAADRLAAAPAQMDLLNEVDVCSDRIKDSDVRLNRVRDAVNIAEASLTLEHASKASEAASALTAFDASRSAKARGTTANKAAEFGSAAQAFKDQLTRLVSLVRLWRPDDPATINIADDLVKIRTVLLKQPIRPSSGELSDTERTALITLEAVKSSVDGSDARLMSALVAYGRRGADPAGALHAIASLNFWDRARWEVRADKPVSLSEAERELAATLPEVLSELSGSYQTGHERAKAEQLVRLAEMGKRIGAVIPDAQQRVVGAAIAELGASISRIARLRQAAESWQQVRRSKSRDPAAETEILGALRDVIVAGEARPNAFDVAGMTDSDKMDFDKALAASVEIQRTAPPGAASAISVSVDASALRRDRLVAPLADALSAGLQRKGFKLAQSAGEAAIVVGLSDPAMTGGGIDNRTGEQIVDTRVNATLRWVYSGGSVALGALSAQGKAREPGQARASSFERLADLFADSVLNAVEGH